MHDDFAEFITRLTDNARMSLQYADSIARGYGSNAIGTEHLMLGVLAQGSSVGAKVMADAGITLQRVESALNLAPATTGGNSSVMRLSESVILTLKMGWEVAREYHQDYMGTEHILYSILKQPGSSATSLLRRMGVSTDEVLDNLEEYLDRQVADSESAKTTSGRRRKSGGGALEVFGIDITARAQEGELDPVIGRDKETERMITILSRRTKTNPVLIGEPGVGKTAIVEGLAQRIVREEVPNHLLDKRVIQLDLAALVAGTKYRGEFEERLKKVVSEVASQKNILLFIDELHALTGAGSAEGSMDAANILKPALARGELNLIGATTLDEYRKHIEKDSALERRFQTIIVKEPNVKTTLAVIKGLRSYYESHHGVSMSDEVLETAVYMADRYISDRFMPDKAIDVIDEAAALVRVKQGHRPSKVRDYTKQLKNLNERMEDAVAAEDYERAALYKTRMSQISAELEKSKESAEKGAPVKLTDDDVARAISVMTSIPLEKVQKSEAKLLKNLEKHLSKYVIGQKEAVAKVSRAIRRNRSGITSSGRPIGSFVFMGPTGVGKTELARVLAREVFGSSDALVKIDMSEFGEKFSVTRLIGAPAGYVGYDEGGKLTDKIRRQPYSVVLLDEIEKAHRDVFQLMLQILEDGKLTDSKGRSVDFSNTIVILTSNVGAEQMMKESKLGFQATTNNEKRNLEAMHQHNSTEAKKELSKMMQPELINRFDGIVTFQSLSRSEVGKIFDILIDDLQERLVKLGVRLKVTSGAKKHLIDKGFDEKFGARPLRRAIEDELEHEIADGILSEKYQKGDILEVRIKGGQLEIDVKQESK